MSEPDSVGYYEFPVQNNPLGQAVEVSLTGDSGREVVPGKIVRDDLVDPLITMIELKDGFVVLGDEKDDFRRPLQGPWVGSPAEVRFGDDTSKVIVMGGEIVRNDAEEPLRTIIKLGGWFVLGSECMYRAV